MYVLLSFLLLFTSTCALYKDSKHVVSLNNDNFDEIVLKNEEPWLINFYAPWCKHCVRFENVYEGVARQLKHFFHFGAVDVTEYKMLKKRFKIRKFPTLMIFHGDKSKPKEYSGRKDQRSIVLSLLYGDYE